MTFISPDLPDSESGAVTWNYRLFQRTVPDGVGGYEDEFYVGEAFYRDDELVGWSEQAVTPGGTTPEELGADLERYLGAVRRPIIDLAGAEEPVMADATLGATEAGRQDGCSDDWRAEQLQAVRAAFGDDFDARMAELRSVLGDDFDVADIGPLAPDEDASWIATAQHRLIPLRAAEEDDERETGADTGMVAVGDVAAGEPDTADILCRLCGKDQRRYPHDHPRGLSRRERPDRLQS